MASVKGASLTDLRLLNSSTVFEAIKRHAPVSRSELAREVGLTRPTVSSALSTLVRAGLIRESSPASGRPHYGATYFEMVPEAAHFLAIEIEPGLIRAVLGDAAGARQAVVTSDHAPTSPAEIVAELAAVATAACAAADLALSDIAVLVLAVPAAVHPGNQRLRSRVLPALSGMALGPALESRLQRPVVIENDINLAAVGECERGAARHARDFVYLSIGRRVGAGIVLNREIWRGSHGGAGELLTLGPGPGSGDLERLVSQLKHDEPVSFANNPPAIFAAAGRGDPIARHALSVQAGRIATAVVSMCQVLDVELVVLGGAVGRLCQPLLGPIEERLRSQLPVVPELAISQLPAGAVQAGACFVGSRHAMRLVTPRLLGQVIRPDAQTLLAVTE